MLVRAPRIVRFLSVSRLDTWRVTRSRKQTARPPQHGQQELAPRHRRSTSSQLHPTPVPPAELLARAGELRTLVDELVDLTGCGDAWGVRVLRRNIELAVVNPDTLGSADNQLDFIEELAEAVWDGADAALRQAVALAATPEETVRREGRRRASLARLDELTHQLCAAAEAWRDVIVATAEAAQAVVRNPQEDYRL